MADMRALDVADVRAMDVADMRALDVADVRTLDMVIEGEVTCKGMTDIIIMPLLLKWKHTQALGKALVNETLPRTDELSLLHPTLV